MAALDPYKTLGVRRNASPEAIKKAFRKKSLLHHPDRGGSQEAFEEVALCHRVLSDPRRRAHYDATGDMGSDVPDNSMGAVLQVISQAFIVVVNTLAKDGKNPAQEDLVEHLRACLKEQSEEVREQLEKGRKAREKVATLQGRFSVVDDGESDPPTNMLEELVIGQLAFIDREIKAREAAEEVRTKAIKFLDGYRFRADPQASNGIVMRAMMGGTATAASTSATNAGMWRSFGS